MDTYGQYCPVARGAEIFAMRWTPIIVRNLLLGCRTFSEIQAGAPGIPRSLLSERLRLLEQYDILERVPNPSRRGWLYQLTDAGEELDSVCDALGTWGARWLEVAPHHLDPLVVLWGMCRLIDKDQLPDTRVVVRFELRDAPRQRFWVLIQKPAPEVCIKPPGFEEDLIVTSDCEWLAKWHMGRLTLGQAMHHGVITVHGPRPLIRALATRWAGLSKFANVAPVVRAETVQSSKRTRRRAAAARRA
jgi:DNA-binding HxlR family transcriptional regulator